MGTDLRGKRCQLYAALRGIVAVPRQRMGHGVKTASRRIAAVAAVADIIRADRTDRDPLTSGRSHFDPDRRSCSMSWRSLKVNAKVTRKNTLTTVNPRAGGARQPFPSRPIRPPSKATPQKGMHSNMRMDRRMTSSPRQRLSHPVKIDFGMTGEYFYFNELQNINLVWRYPCGLRHSTSAGKTVGGDRAKQISGLPCGSSGSWTR